MTCARERGRHGRGGDGGRDRPGLRLLLPAALAGGAGQPADGAEREAQRGKTERRERRGERVGERGAVRGREGERARGREGKGAVLAGEVPAAQVDTALRRLLQVDGRQFTVYAPYGLRSRFEGLRSTVYGLRSTRFELRVQGRGLRVQGSWRSKQPTLSSLFTPTSHTSRTPHSALLSLSDSLHTPHSLPHPYTSTSPLLTPTLLQPPGVHTPPPRN
eukprot:913563-Rhodomonas_salina.2